MIISARLTITGKFAFKFQIFLLLVACTQFQWASCNLIFNLAVHLVNEFRSFYSFIQCKIVDLIYDYFQYKIDCLFF